jgi:cell division protease FtsH
VRRVIGECYERARKLLEENRDKLNRIAAALIERESLDTAAIDALIEGRELPAKDAAGTTDPGDHGTEPIGPAGPSNAPNPADPDKDKLH